MATPRYDAIRRFAATTPTSESLRDFLSEVKDTVHPDHSDGIHVGMGGAEKLAAIVTDLLTLHEFDFILSDSCLCTTDEPQAYRDMVESMLLELQHTYS